MDHETLTTNCGLLEIIMRTERNTLRLGFLGIVAVTMACAAIGPAAAQQYPNKPVRIVTPYPPGGGGDLLARVFGDRLSKTWGQPVVIDNRPGAATIIGTELVAKAVPDGYTLLVTSDSSITSNPHLYPKMGFDPLRDLAPVTQLIGSNMVMVVHPSVPARSIAELVALAKSQPGKLNYGSFGGGSQPNLAFEALKTETGISIAHIPYKGLGPAMTAVVAGEVQMTMTSAAIAVGQISSGKLRALAITRADRSPLMPDLPTLKDAGYPGIDPRSWFGLWSAGGTPAPVVSRIQRDVAQLIVEPEFRDREIVRRGYSPGGQSPEEFAAFIREDYEFKGRMIKASGIKAD
jgi:tripartite-type tricarboxylate transporter receptor subunit TctC